MSVRAFRAGLQSIERGSAKLAARDGGGLLSTLGDASTLARRVLPVDDSSFVWGPVGSGLSADPTQTVAKLYERFVTQFDARPRGSAHDDAAVWRPVHDLLVARKIADRLAPKTISSAVDHVEFEHAWKNGAWHVYQPLSFDRSSNDHIRDKAAKWAGHLLGLAGADEDFRPHFIVGPPSNSAMRDAYERALDLLRLPQGGRRWSRFPRRRGWWTGSRRRFGRTRGGGSGPRVQEAPKSRSWRCSARRLHHFRFPSAALRVRMSLGGWRGLRPGPGNRVKLRSCRVTEAFRRGGGMRNT